MFSCRKFCYRCHGHQAVWTECLCYRTEQGSGANISGRECAKLMKVAHEFLIFILYIQLNKSGCTYNKLCFLNTYFLKTCFGCWKGFWGFCPLLLHPALLLDHLNIVFYPLLPNFLFSFCVIFVGSDQWWAEGGERCAGPKQPQDLYMEVGIRSEN